MQRFKIGVTKITEGGKVRSVVDVLHGQLCLATSFIIVMALASFV